MSVTTLPNLDSFVQCLDRHKVSRVDVESQPENRCLVLIYNEGWNVDQAPDGVYIVEVPMSEIRAYFLGDPLSWSMKEWVIGFRVWNGEPRPIRSGRTIKKKRSQINSSRGWYEKQGINNIDSINLAFYM